MNLLENDDKDRFRLYHVNRHSVKSTKISDQTDYMMVEVMMKSHLKLHQEKNQDLK